MSVPQVILDTAQKIMNKEIRGSTQAAIEAMNALVSGLHTIKANSIEEIENDVKEWGRILLSARPSNIMLANSIRYVLDKLKNMKTYSFNEAVEHITQDIIKLSEKINEAVQSITLIASRHIEDGDVILTHSLSTTVLKTLFVAHDAGKNISVIVTESRPDFEGRITASQLASKGIPVTLIVDSAVRYVMKDVDKVIIGAEAVAANGAIVNKIGTSVVAMVAYEARVRVHVLAGTYKFSPETMIGIPIKIEERDPTVILPDEVRKTYGLFNVKVRAPIYDLTPPEYIDMIITERGVFPPQAAILILKESYGWPPLNLNLTI
ncbi:MAG: ribose 1,5-bisphosphate isomerase [Thermoprotei archaeon]